MTDWARVDAMYDEEIDGSDDPEITPEMADVWHAIPMRKFWYNREPWFPGQSLSLRCLASGGMRMTLEELLTDIHALEEELLAFERTYGVRSEVFYAAYVS